MFSFVQIHFGTTQLTLNDELKLDYLCSVGTYWRGLEKCLNFKSLRRGGGSVKKPRPHLTRCDTDLGTRMLLYVVQCHLTGPKGSPLNRGPHKTSLTPPLRPAARCARPPSLSSEVIHTVSDVSGVQSNRRNRQRVPLERMRPCIGRGDVRTERKGNPESWRQHRLCCHFQFFKFCLLQAFGLSSSVLKPDFNLGLRQVERTGELCALGDRKVLLLAELPL